LVRTVKTATDKAGTLPPAGTDAAAWTKKRDAQIESATLFAQLGVARAFTRAKSWPDAEQWLKRMLDKKPDYDAALLVMGDMYLIRQMWPQARDVYVGLLKRWPGNYIAGNNLAWVLAAQLKDYQQAYQVAQEIRKDRVTQKPLPGNRLDPSFLDTLGEIYTDWNRSDLYAEMRDTFMAARERYPLDPRMSYYLGRAYDGLAQPEKAEEMYIAAVAAANPDAKPSVSPETCKEIIKKVEDARKKPKAPGGP
jgi:tetratricopeptide (TPR) repeat protein